MNNLHLIAWSMIHQNHEYPLWEPQHFAWLSNYEFQHVTFNLHFINDLLVSTRYNSKLTLTQ